MAEDAGVPVGAVGTLISSLVDFASPSGQVDNVTDPDGGAQLELQSPGPTRPMERGGIRLTMEPNGTHWAASAIPMLDS